MCTDTVRAHHRPHQSVLLHEGLPLSVPHLYLHHHPLRRSLSPSIPQLLVSRIHQGQEASQKCPGCRQGPEQQRHLAQQTGVNAYSNFGNDNLT